MTLILLAGAALRFIHIGDPFVDTYSWRQASTAMMAESFMERPNILLPEVRWTGPDPGFQGREFQTITFLTSLLWRIFGQSDSLARAVAVMFGLLTIFSLYMLTRLVWDETRALLAAAVLAVLPGAVFVDRSFLPDPAMVALVTTACWLLVAYFKTGKRHYLLIGAAVGALGFLTKIPGLVAGAPIAYAAYAVLGRQKLLNPKVLFKLAAIAAAMVIPTIAYYLWALHVSRTYPPHIFAGSSGWIWVDFRAWVDEFFFLPKAFDKLRKFYWTPWTMLLCVVAMTHLPANPLGGTDQTEEVGDDRPLAPWFFHWWLVGCAVFYFIGAREIVDNPWNFHLFSPGIAALTAQGMCVASRRLNVERRAAGRSLLRNATALRIGLLVLIIAVSGQFGLIDLYHPYAAASHSMGLALESVSAKGDLVATIANDPGDPIAIYYSKRRGWLLPPAGGELDYSFLPDDDKALIGALEDLRTRGAQWLGVVSSPAEGLAGGYPEFVDHLEENFERTVEGPDWTVYRLSSD